MKEVEVYFKNENDAVSAQTDLNKFKVKNLTLEEVPEGKRKTGFLPIFTPSWQAGGPAVPFTKEDSDDNEAKKADSKYMSHLLRFEVEEGDYEEAISILKNHDAYHLQTEND